MTGQEEIEALARTCRDIAKHLPDSCGPMVVIPLYASLPPAQQLRVFQPAPKVREAVNMQETQGLKRRVVLVCSQLLFLLGHVHHCFTATLKAQRMYMYHTLISGLQEGHPLNQHCRDVGYDLGDQIRHRHGDGEGQTLQSW